MCETPCVKISSYDDAVHYINEYAHVLETMKNGKTPTDRDINIFAAALTVFICIKAKASRYYKILCSRVGGVESLGELVGRFWEKKINSVVSNYDPQKQPLSAYLQRTIENFFIDVIRNPKRFDTLPHSDSEPGKKRYQTDFVELTEKYINLADYNEFLIDQQEKLKIKHIENAIAVLDEYPLINIQNNIERRLVYHGKKIQGEFFKNELNISDPYRILSECKSTSFKTTLNVINRNYESILKYKPTFMGNICNQISTNNLENVKFLEKVDITTQEGRQRIRDWTSDIYQHLQTTLIERQK